MNFICNSNNNSNDNIHRDTPNAIVTNSVSKKSKHEFKVLTAKEVYENRSKAYSFISF